MMRNRWMFGVLVGLLASMQFAQANIVFHFTTVWTGNTPNGTSPWATMTINNISGGVQVNITHNNTSAPGQFLRELFLKFNTLPTSAHFTSDPYITGITLGNTTNAGLSFNVQVNFKSAPPSQRLLPGGTASFKLFGVSEADFAGQNTSAMVHLQGIQLPGGQTGSSKLIAPEPASMIALGTGLVSLLGLRRRRQR
ncbi:MAG: PEP-CTERM sorting domain-containing protein [Fimbriimonadales bacterium]|nr:PEP-CTERM sorting domain-containing protein [Fimbriimonadales bacterium]